MAVVEATHHSSRGQRHATVIRKVEEHEQYEAPRRQKAPPPGMQPASLVEPPGSQERIQQHTVEQFGDLAPFVQILDAPVPQTVDQLADVLWIIDVSVPEQTIDVPKISQDVIPQRVELCVPELAEQLVTIQGLLATCGTRSAGREGEVLLVACWHSPRPVNPLPRGTHRQPRAVNKHWARVTWLTLL